MRGFVRSRVWWFGNRTCGRGAIVVSLRCGQGNDDDEPVQPEPQPEPLKRLRSARTSYAELPDENGEIETIADTISTVTPTSADIAAAEAAGAFDATPESIEPVAIADSGSAAGGASDADGANSDEVRPARKSEPAAEDEGLPAVDQPGDVAG